MFAMLALASAGLPERGNAEDTSDQATAEASSYNHEETIRRKQEIQKQLDAAWRKQASALRKRFDDVMARRKAAEEKLQKHAKLPSLKAKWQIIVSEMHSGGGVAHVALDTYVGSLHKMESIVMAMEIAAGMTPPDNTAFWKDYAVTVEERVSLERTHKELLMTDGTGHVIGMFHHERKNNPSLKPSQYLDTIANQIRTMEDLAFYLRYFMRYTWDSSDANDPWKKGTGGSLGDFFQSAEETVQRTENGKMLGDCEDTSILAHDIMKRWGVRSFLLEMPGHIVCVRIDRTSRNRYIGYSIDNFGLDRNGRGFGATTGISNGADYNGGNYPTDFGTPEEAVDAVTKKYRSVPTFNLGTWSAYNGAKIVHQRWDEGYNGKWVRRNVSYITVANGSLGSYSNDQVPPSTYVAK